MINLRELITFDDRLENSLSSRRRELRSEMKDLTQKLRDSRLVRDESKISFSEEIRHVASNENEFERVNDSFVDNDSNDSSNDDFVSTASFTRSALSVAVLDATARQDERQFRDFERKCQSADHCFIDSEIFDSVYD